MKKTFYVIIAMTILVSYLCSCTKKQDEVSGTEGVSDMNFNEDVTTEISTTEETTEISVEGLNLMQLALLGKADIYDVKNKNTKTITQLLNYREDFDFTYLDLDRDGLEEVVLHFYGECSILHEKDGIIYRYPISERVGYNTDGTVCIAGTAKEAWLSKIKEFTDTEIVLEHIYIFYDDKYYKVYEKDGEQIELTEDELTIIREQYKDIGAERFNYNYDNIVTLLSDR